MKAYFATLFEHIRHERILFLLFSLIDERILKQAGLAVFGKNIVKNLALQKYTDKDC